jgi:AraC-like DNA-binding protein
VDLLCRSDKPLKAVALEVGFADEKSFARAFRAWTGRSPSEVRRTPPPG